MTPNDKCEPLADLWAFFFQFTVFVLGETNVHAKR